MKLRIYRKSSNETLCFATKIEVTRKWMDESFAVVDVQSASPIDFEDGDWLMYVGHIYQLDLGASVTKRSSRNTVGDGFKYEGLRFVGIERELKNVMMLDYIDSDSDNTDTAKPYTMQGQWYLFCKTFDDLIERMNANLRRAGLTNWTIERDESAVLSAVNVNVSFDNESLWETVKKFETVFRTSYVFEAQIVGEEPVCKVVVGREVKMESEALCYGKGHALTEIQKGFDESNGIVNKLYVYGSENNFNPQYYTGRYVKKYDGSYGAVSVDPNDTEYSEGKVGSVVLSPFANKQEKKDEEPLITAKYLETSGSSNFFKVYVVNEVQEIGTQYFDGANLMHIDSTAYLLVDVMSGHSTKGATIWGKNGDTYTKLTEGQDLQDYEVRDSKQLVSEDVQAYIYNSQYTRNVQSTGVASKRPASNAIKLATLRTTIKVEGIGGTPKVTASRTLTKYNATLSDYIIEQKAISGEDDHLDISVQTDKKQWKVFTSSLATLQVKNDIVLKTNLIARKEENRFGSKRGFAQPGIAVKNLMLPGFPQKTNLYLEDTESIEKYGVREGTVYFDSNDFDNGKVEVFPTLEGMTIGLLRESGYDVGSRFGAQSTKVDYVDEVLMGSVTPSGAPLDDGKPVSNGDKMSLPDGQISFKIWIKDIGFDMKEYCNNADPSITFNTGACAGRTFKINRQSVTKVTLYANGTGEKISETKTDECKRAFSGWSMQLHREPDSALNNLYFPNANALIGGVNEAREEYRPGETGVMKHSDQFVISGILMPFVYVDVASARLKAYGEEYLKTVSKCQVQISPKINNVYMQKDYDANGRNSLRYRLSEGMEVKFVDEDLNVRSGDTDSQYAELEELHLKVDTLTIKEGTTPVPEYGIVLREKKKYSMLQILQGRLAYVSAGVGTASEGVQETQKMYQSALSMGSGDYLSKTEEDRAEGHITFGDGVTIEGDTVTDDVMSRDYVEGSRGYGHWKDANGRWHLETDILNVRTKIESKEIVAGEVKHAGGEIMLTAAEGIVEEVLQFPGSVVLMVRKKSEDGYDLMNLWKVDDMAYCQTWDKEGEGNRFWWYKVIDTGDGTQFTDFDESRTYAEYYYVVLDLQDGADGSDIPNVGDRFVQLGHVDDESRQGCTIISGAGERKGSYLVFDGINDYVLPEPKVEISPKRVNITADSLSIVVDGGKKSVEEMMDEVNEVVEEVTDISKQLDHKFDIYQLDDDSDKDDETGEPLPEMTVAQMGAHDAELLWKASEYSEHYGDFALFADGVCYLFTEANKWLIRVDEYLVPYLKRLFGAEKKIADAGNDITDLNKKYESQSGAIQTMENDLASVFVKGYGGFTTSFSQSAGVVMRDNYASLFVSLFNEQGSAIKTALAGVFVDEDELSTFKVKADNLDIDTNQIKLTKDKFVISTPQFKLNEDGSAVFSGIIEGAEIMIDNDLSVRTVYAGSMTSSYGYFPVSGSKRVIIGADDAPIMINKSESDTVGEYDSDSITLRDEEGRMIIIKCTGIEIYDKNGKKVKSL